MGKKLKRELTEKQLLADSPGRRDRTCDNTVMKHNEVLLRAYTKALEADKTKISFIHYISNKMSQPTDTIDRTVTSLCNNYHNITPQEIKQQVDMINQQSKSIVDLLNHMNKFSDSGTGKEGSV